MTLRDIARLIQNCGIPRSKTVECLYPHPSLTIYVPREFINVVGMVAQQMLLPGQHIDVCLLDSLDVRPMSHLYVKVKGATRSLICNDADSPTQQRIERQRTARMRNRDVVIECAPVAS